MVWLSAGRVMYGNLLATLIVFNACDMMKEKIGFRAVHASHLDGWERDRKTLVRLYRNLLQPDLTSL
jgi:hypothetical protein